MKTYTGTKTINATPMTRGAYNTFRGWELPANEDGNDEGYLVEYTDGGQANTTAYKGYVSWSPKTVFERAYTRVLPAYQQRVIDEKAELDAKIMALRGFLNTELFGGLSPAEQIRLVQQESTMYVYSTILGERIEAF